MLTPVTLEGDLVRLEPLSIAHLDGLCDVGFQTDIWAHMLVHITDRAGMTAFIEAAGGATQLPFAVIDRRSNRVAGSTRYMNYELAHKRVEIGSTWYGTEFQRTGINTETKLLLFRHAFERLDMNRVELKTDSLNTRSRQAILRLGAIEEGTLRRHMIVPARVRDTVYYSVIREEWPAIETRLQSFLRRA